MDAATTAASTITHYVAGLTPAFIAGFGVQQTVEVIDSLVSGWVKWDPSNPEDVRKKKAILSCVSVAIAAVLTGLGGGNIDVLKPFIKQGYQWGFFGGLISVIFISGGTEGFNTLMKWLSYKKEDAKATAAKNKGGGASTTDCLKMMPS